MDLPLDFKELLEEFERDAVEAVIVGGYAVAFHGRPRATKDIDLVLEGSRENLDRAATALERFGAPPNVVAAIRAMQHSEVVFMGQPPLRVDFLRMVDGVSESDLFARVISMNDLITNKRAAGRPQDLMDAEFLERVRAASST